MLVSHKETGYSCHCFRCGEHKFEPHGQRSIAEIQRHKRELLLQHSKEPFLPKDYTLDVPLKHATWFLQYGISAEVARRYGIGWSEYFHRIVLPVFDFDGNLAAVQMRAMNSEQKPKYLNPGGAAIRKALFWSSRPTNDVVVVVEDMMSALKVGRYTSAVSCLGTTMADERAVRIAAECSNAILWLDNDKAGRKGMQEAHRQLSMQGVKCWKVESELDPKRYNVDQIKDHLRRMKPC